MNKKLLWPLLLIAVFAVSRWPGLMPQNFSATYAILFCAGLYIPGWMGWVIPIAVVAGTDILITFFFYTHGDFSPALFFTAQLPNYLAYVGLIGLGRLFGGKRPLWLLAGGGLVGALIFYIVTNTAAWISLPYAKTFAGWIQAITIGFPEFPPTWEFFRNTLLSGGVFTGLFAAAMKMGEESEEAEAEENEAAPVREPEGAQTESQVQFQDGLV